MRIRAVVFGAIVMGSPAALMAQQVPVTAGPVSGIAPPPPPRAQANPGSTLSSPMAFLFGNMPVLVLNDGRVFADFGLGWEQVVRSCTLPVEYGIPGISTPSLIQPAVAQPTVTQPTIGPTSVAWPSQPPVPAQAASQQVQTQNGQPVQAAATTATQSCWAIGPSGRVFVGRP